VDVAVIWKLTDHFSLAPKASLLRATDERKNDYLVFIPPNRYELTLRYEKVKVAGFENFYFETGYRYIDKQHRAPRTIMPQTFLDAAKTGTDPLQGSDDNFDFMNAPSAYGLLHASIGVALKGEKTRYDFRVASENVLNSTYREYTNRFRYFADEIGRNFILSAKCIF
jgi:iron complex outermembrane receptor protein